MLSCEQGGVPHVFGQWEGGHLHSMLYFFLRGIDLGLFPLDGAGFEAKALLTFDVREYQFMSAQFQKRQVFPKR